MLTFIIFLKQVLECELYLLELMVSIFLPYGWEEGSGEQGHSGTQTDGSSLHICISVKAEAKSLGKHRVVLKDPV